MGVLNRNRNVVRRRSLSRLGFLAAAAAEVIEPNTPTPAPAPAPAPVVTAPAPVATVTPTPVATVTTAPVAVEPAPPPPVAAVYVAPTPTPAPALTLAPVATEPALVTIPLFDENGSQIGTQQVDPTNPMWASAIKAYAPETSADYPTTPAQSGYKWVFNPGDSGAESGVATAPTWTQQTSDPTLMWASKLGLSVDQVNTLASQPAGSGLTQWDVIVRQAEDAQSASESKQDFDSAITPVIMAASFFLGPELAAAYGGGTTGAVAAGATVGAGSAAVTGGDVVKGAAIGAAGGAAASYAGDLFTPTAEAVVTPVSAPPVIESEVLSPLPTSEEIIASQESAFTTSPAVEQVVITAPPIEPVAAPAPLVVPVSAPVWVSAGQIEVVTTQPDFADTMPPANPMNDQPGAWENVYGNTWHQVEPIPQVVITAPPIEAVAEPESLFVPPTSEQIIAAQESAAFTASPVEQVVITDSPMMPPAILDAEAGTPTPIDSAPVWVQAEIPQVVITAPPTMPPAILDAEAGTPTPIDSAPVWVQAEQFPMPPAILDTQTIQQGNFVETAPGQFEQAPSETFTPSDSFTSPPPDSSTTSTTQMSEPTNTQNPPPGGGGGNDPFSFDNLIKVGTKLLPGLLFKNPNKSVPATRRPLPVPEYLNKPAPTQAGMGGNFWLFAGLGLMAVVLDAPKKRRRR